MSEKSHKGEIPQHWRDPYVWKQDGRWLMVLVGKYEGDNFGRVFLYQSENLTDWELIGDLIQGTSSQGFGWECPNYFPLEDKYMLVVSPFGPVIYSVGDFDGARHHANRWHTLDHGKQFYATNTYMDGALDSRTKEMLGLVASMVLRCDDCIKYHLIQCHEQGFSTAEMMEIFGVANLVGGTIVIPHTRRALEFWDELQSA